MCEPQNIIIQLKENDLEDDSLIEVEEYEQEMNAFINSEFDQDMMLEFMNDITGLDA